MKFVYIYIYIYIYPENFQSFNIKEQVAYEVQFCFTLLQSTPKETSHPYLLSLSRVVHTGVVWFSLISNMLHQGHTTGFCNIQNGLIQSEQMSYVRTIIYLPIYPTIYRFVYAIKRLEFEVPRYDVTI